jgi:diadenosine tetraphosphate (Ap4A) HIT family hydrolase
LGVAESFQRAVETVMEIFRVPGNSVRQVVFHVIPDKFIGIEFRGVGWQEMRVQSRMFPKKFADDLGPMG